MRRIPSYRVCLAIALAAVGCAVADTTPLQESVDPNVPGVDAGYGPTKPRSDGGTTIPSGTGEDDKGDAGTTTPPDSGGPTNPDGGSAPKPAQGEVLITEVMYDPSGNEPSTEWFELTNTASEARNVGGLLIADGANRTHTIAGNLVIGAGEIVVLARNKNAAMTAQVPSAAIVYEYGAGLADNLGVQLANGSTGGLTLRDGATLVARAEYGGWFSSGNGASIQLKANTYSSTATAGGWCVSTTAWATGSGMGTPGAASNCP